MYTSHQVRKPTGANWEGVEMDAELQDFYMASERSAGAFLRACNGIQSCTILFEFLSSNQTNSEPLLNMLSTTNVLPLFELLMSC